MRKATVVVVIMLAMLVIPVAAASADPGTHTGTTPASCTGIESSGIAPAGSSDEFPGGRPQLNVVLRGLFPDTPLGQIVSGFSKVHAGSHEGCDAE